MPLSTHGRRPDWTIISGVALLLCSLGVMGSACGLCSDPRVTPSADVDAARHLAPESVAPGLLPPVPAPPAVVASSGSAESLAPRVNVEIGEVTVHRRAASARTPATGSSPP